MNLLNWLWTWLNNWWVVGSCWGKGTRTLYFANFYFGMGMKRHENPSDLSPTAKRHIRHWQCSWFWLELPGGDEFLPSGATLFMFILVISMLFVQESIWFLELMCVASIGHFVGLKSIKIGAMAKLEIYSCMNWIGFTQENKDRDTFMKWIKSTKLVHYICIVASWWL